MQVREVFDSQSPERRQRRAVDPSFRDPCSWDDDREDAVSPIRRRPVDNVLPDERRRPISDTTVCSCCTESLARLIRREFRRGDPIGITFVEQGVATVFVGIFLDLSGTVLVIRDLFLDDLISFIPLCDISSIEAGCALSNSGSSPMTVAP